MCVYIYRKHIYNKISSDYLNWLLITWDYNTTWLNRNACCLIWSWLGFSPWKSAASCKTCSTWFFVSDIRSVLDRIRNKNPKHPNKMDMGSWDANS